MEHLNYCRQMIRQFANFIGSPKCPAMSREVLTHAIRLAQASKKFLLPDGGRLYDDPEYRALDENEPLRLPYPFIALEYSRSDHPADMPAAERSSKAIVFAREKNDGIIVMIVAWNDFAGGWVPYPEIVLPKVGYLDRTVVNDGFVAIRAVPVNRTVPPSDYCDELGALFCFLNVLQCRNVHLERSEPRKSGKKIKAALQFDTYHILTIDVPSKASQVGAATSGHRSPREHLRRGHIRRLADGRRIWVNATVVAAGRGSGVVTKDYAVRCAA